MDALLSIEAPLQHQVGKAKPRTADARSPIPLRFIRGQILGRLGARDPHRLLPPARRSCAGTSSRCRPGTNAGSSSTCRRSSTTRAGRGHRPRAAVNREHCLAMSPALLKCAGQRVPRTRWAAIDVPGEGFRPRRLAEPGAFIDLDRACTGSGTERPACTETTGRPPDPGHDTTAATRRRSRRKTSC
jgi:hypothetical protein